MATSRGGTPANPTLVATTDDAARGGLFARSNTGGIAGSMPTNITVNDSTITLDINGTSQSFTLNQANDQTLTFTVDGGGSSGPVTPTTDTFIETVQLVGNELVFNYNAASGRSPERTSLAAIAGGHTEQQIRDWADEQINAYHTTNTFVRTVNGDAPDANGNVIVTGGATSITAADFESTDNSIVFADNSTTGDVNIQARPVIRAQDTQHSASGAVSGSVNFAELDIDLTIGGRRVILRDTGSGRYTLGLDSTAPPVNPNPTGSVNTPAPTTIFETPVDETVVVNVNDVTAIDQNPTVTVMDPNGNSITPNVVITQPPTGGGNGNVEVTIPSSDISDPGDYTVDATIPTTDLDGMPANVPVMTTVERIVPFVQLRGTAPATSADLSGSNADISTTAWPNNNEFTARDGSGTLFLAVDSTENIRFRMNTAGQDAVLVTVGASQSFLRARRLSTQLQVTAGTSTITYNVYQFAGSITPGSIVAFAT